MERKNKERKPLKRGAKGKRKAVTHQAVVPMERALGLTKTRQTLRNVGNAAGVGFLRAPAGPRPGAHYSTRQFGSTFTTSSGFAGVGGASSQAQLVQSGATAVYFAAAFQLADLGQASSFATIFDQYRIDLIRFHLRTRNPMVSTFNTASPNGAVPVGWIVVDRDDASPLTSSTEALQYENCIEFSGYDSVEVDLVPSLTPSLFASGAFSGYSTRDSDGLWLDMANTNIPAFGIKGSIGPLSATTTSSWTWDVFTEYIVSFRNTR